MCIFTWNLVTNPNKIFLSTACYSGEFSSASPLAVSRGRLELDSCFLPWAKFSYMIQKVELFDSRRELSIDEDVHTAIIKNT